jgi:hypothetical protein
VSALFHILIHLARLRWLGAAFCALAMLCFTAHASALAGATAHARIDVRASIDITTTASASKLSQAGASRGGGLGCAEGICSEALGHLARHFNSDVRITLRIASNLEPTRGSSGLHESKNSKWDLPKEYRVVLRFEGCPKSGGWSLRHMRTFTACGFVVLACAVVACSDGGSSGSVNAPNNGGTQSSATQSGGSGNGGSSSGNTTNASSACTELTATRNADGVLTPFPNIDVSVTPAAFQLTTLNFVVTEDGDPRGPLLEMLADIKNTGTKTECDFIPSIYLDGEELVGLPKTPPYMSTLLTSLTNDCLGPGETGAISAVARGVTKAELAAAGSLLVDLEPNTYGTYNPAKDPPQVTAEIAKLATGWGVKGTVTPKATIRNLEIRIFARNSQGVLTADLGAYPNTLGTLALGVPVSFESTTTPCEFEGYALYTSWIVGAQ